MEDALRAAATLARRGNEGRVDRVGIAEAVAAARAASASIIRQNESTAAAQSALPPPSAVAAQPTPSVDVLAAARNAAAAVAASMSLGGAAASAAGDAAAPPPLDADAAKRAAAAAFAESIRKRPRWGDGSSALVDAPAPPDPGKERQALVVSQLQDKLAAFRKDRGVDAPAAPGAILTLKLYVPDKAPGMQFPRNWVGIFIGRDGVNKKRFEAEVPGVRIFVRGEGTQLRGSKPLEDNRRGKPKDTGKGKGKGKGGGKGGGGRGGADDDDDDVEALHVLLEADNQEALDTARVRVLAELNPKRESSALMLYDEQQLATLAMEKTTDSEECAFCGKPGHHHSKCPQRTSTFKMTSIVCAACGCGGHTAKDCKGDRSNIVNIAGHTKGPKPSGFEDADFAAFEAELLRRG